VNVQIATPDKNKNTMIMLMLITPHNSLKGITFLYMKGDAFHI